MQKRNYFNLQGYGIISWLSDDWGEITELGLISIVNRQRPRLRVSIATLRKEISELDSLAEGGGDDSKDYFRKLVIQRKKIINLEWTFPSSRFEFFAYDFTDCFHMKY